jgi:Fe-S cluster biogenesis protein NfuA
VDASVNLATVGDQIEQLLGDLEAAQPRGFGKVEELMRLVTGLYAGGLERITAIAAASPAVIAEIVEDKLVAGLLLVHGLHPHDVRTRVEGALEQVRPFLAQHGGDVELLDIDLDAGAVLLRLLGSCDGCPSSAVTLQMSVEKAVLDAAPEIGIIDVEPPTVDPILVPGATVIANSSAVPIMLSRKRTYDLCPTEVTV